VKKIAQNVAKLLLWKTRIWAISLIFIKLPKINTDPIGKNSTNLATLSVAIKGQPKDQLHFRRAFSLIFTFAFSIGSNVTYVVKIIYLQEPIRRLTTCSPCTENLAGFDLGLSVFRLMR
jgi:hypothetical protein